MPQLRSYRLAELTSPEVADALAGGIATIILPVGSTEQHGAHLPLSTDSLHTVAVLERVAESLPALVAPLIPVGRADHHMAFPGTITVKHETLHATIRDWCDSFFQHGFRHVLIYSGHGGNAVPLARIIDDLTREDGGRSIIGCTDWSVYDGTLFPCAEALGIGQFEAGWHAGELETSMILALDERLVMMDRAAPGFIGDLAPLRETLMREGVKAIAPTGVLGDPRPATRAHGEAYLDALTKSLTRFFRSALDRREQTRRRQGRRRRDDGCGPKKRCRNRPSALPLRLLNSDTLGGRASSPAIFLAANGWRLRFREMAGGDDRPPRCRLSRRGRESGGDDRGGQEIGAVQVQMRRQGCEMEGWLGMAGAVQVAEEKAVDRVVDDAVVGVVRRRADVETGRRQQTIRPEIHLIVEELDMCLRNPAKLRTIWRYLGEVTVKAVS